MNQKLVEETLLNRLVKLIYERHSVYEANVREILYTISLYRLDRKSCKEMLSELERKKLVERISNNKVKIKEDKIKNIQ